MVLLVVLRKETMTVSEISREFNVSSTTVKKWCSHYGIIPERKYK
nr:MAG TPA: helix-turn-helix domain protein [Caudoviricetes sp.]